MPYRSFGGACPLWNIHEAFAHPGNILVQQARMPIGVNCRVCERPDCQQRAFPPVGRHITVDENNRSFVPYLFQ